MPDEIRAAWDHRKQGAAAESSWRELLQSYTKQYPDDAREFERCTRGDLPADFRTTAAKALEPLVKQTAAQATRASSQAALTALAP